MAETDVLRRIASYWSRSQTESVRWRPRWFSFSDGAAAVFRRGVGTAEAGAAPLIPLPCPGLQPARRVRRRRAGLLPDRPATGSGSGSSAGSGPRVGSAFPVRCSLPSPRTSESKAS